MCRCVVIAKRYADFIFTQCPNWKTGTQIKKNTSHTMHHWPQTQRAPAQSRHRSQHNEWWLVVVLCCAGWVFSVLYLCSRHLVRVRPGGPGHGRAQPADTLNLVTMTTSTWVTTTDRRDPTHHTTTHPPNMRMNQRKQKSIINHEDAFIFSNALNSHWQSDACKEIHIIVLGLGHFWLRKQPNKS